MKRLTHEEQELLDALRARVLLTLDFIQSREEFPHLDELKEVIRVTVSRKDLRTMRLIVRDIDAVTIGLNSNDREGLEAVLKDQLGVDTEEERKALQRSVRLVLKRGTIASEKERSRLEQYVELLEALGGDHAEISAIRKLLRST